MTAIVVSGLVAFAAFPACTVETHPTAGVRANRRGDAVIVAPRCTDERIEAVQVADLDGPVRWRVEGGGNASPTIFVVGREPSLMRETDALQGPLDPRRAYVATIEYAGDLPDVDIEFHPSSLSTDRVVSADGEVLTSEAFADEADLECIGGWLWVFGGIAVALVVGLVAAFVVGLWVVVRVVRKAKRQREQAATPGRPDLSGR
jgi:hypothetical protein